MSTCIIELMRNKLQLLSFCRVLFYILFVRNCARAR